MSKITYKGVAYKYEVESRIHKHIENAGREPYSLPISKNQLAIIIMNGDCIRQEKTTIGGDPTYSIRHTILKPCDDIDDNGCGIKKEEGLK